MKKLLFTIAIALLFLAFGKACICDIQKTPLHPVLLTKEYSMINYFKTKITPRAEIVFAMELDANKNNVAASIEISSPTNPDQNKWYGNQSAIFSWKSPAEITGVSIEFDNNPSTLPDFVSEGVFSSKSYERIGNGIWYFHIRIQNKSGWSNVSHFKIQIDRNAPDNFDIEVNNGGDSTSPKPSLYFEAKDDLSGINNYKIKIDDKEVSSIASEEINPFITPLLSFGLHKVVIIAADKAGNENGSFVDVNIEPIPAPEIIAFPALYSAGKEVLYIGGKSLSDSIITIFLKRDNNLIKTWKTTSDKDGSWSFRADELFANGIYAISAQTEDSRGAFSNLSQEQQIEVSLDGIAIGSLLADYGSLILVLALLVAALSAAIVFVCRKTRKERKKIWNETKEAELSLKKTFKELRNNLERKIEYFDSKPGLSANERKIRDDIFKILKSSEKIIEKEIKDIESETS